MDKNLKSLDVNIVELDIKLLPEKCHSRIVMPNLVNLSTLNRDRMGSNWIRAHQLKFVLKMWFFSESKVSQRQTVSTPI